MKCLLRCDCRWKVYWIRSVLCPNGKSGGNDSHLKSCFTLVSLTPRKPSAEERLSDRSVGKQVVWKVLLAHVHCVIRHKLLFCETFHLQICWNSFYLTFGRLSTMFPLLCLATVCLVLCNLQQLGH